MTHKEQFINGLTKARGFNLEDAELIYTKFKESGAAERIRGDHDAEDFVRNTTKPLIEEHTKILTKAIEEATKVFELNIGLENVEINIPSVSIPDSFEIFKNKILPSLKVSYREGDITEHLIIVKTDTLVKRNKLLRALSENGYTNVSELSRKYIFIKGNEYGSCDEETDTFKNAYSIVEFDEVKTFLLIQKI